MTSALLFLTVQSFLVFLQIETIVSNQSPSFNGKKMTPNVPVMFTPCGFTVQYVCVLSSKLPSRLDVSQAIWRVWQLCTLWFHASWQCEYCYSAPDKKHIEIAVCSVLASARSDKSRACCRMMPSLASACDTGLWYNFMEWECGNFWVLNEIKFFVGPKLQICAKSRLSGLV